jgi:hypothetical protein
MTMTLGSKLPNDSGKIPCDQMTMSLSCGILLTSLNDDVISGMHPPDWTTWLLCALTHAGPVLLIGEKYSYG